LVTPSDLAIAGGVLGMGIVSWLIPSRWWSPLGRMFAPLAVWLSDTGGGSVERIRALMGDRIPGRSAPEIRVESFAYFIEGNLQLLRMYRPGGWNPRILLSGQEHLERALARGTGAVLWMSWFKAYGLAAKIALCQAGFEVSHLSHPRHGYGNTRFLIRFLSPLCTRIENLFLRERVPLFAGRLRLAPGGAFLSYASGATLLPVHAVQTGTDQFEVRIDRAIEIPREIDRGEFVERATREYAARLEPWRR
jgi:lauroyl/myristoyl acyltransferase